MPSVPGGAPRGTRRHRQRDGRTTPRSHGWPVQLALGAAQEVCFVVSAVRGSCLTKITTSTTLQTTVTYIDNPVGQNSGSLLGVANRKPPPKPAGYAKDTGASRDELSPGHEGLRARSLGACPRFHVSRSAALLRPVLSFLLSKSAIHPSWLGFS